MMKKAFYTVIVLGVLLISSGSCKKVYHCSCTFNNKVMLNKDLGSQTADDAKEICSGYDSTVAGETWNCTIYY